jgi:hypothetical protein
MAEQALFILNCSAPLRRRAIDCARMGGAAVFRPGRSSVKKAVVANPNNLGSRAAEIEA